MSCSDGCKLKPGIHTLFLGSDLIFQSSQCNNQFCFVVLNVRNLLFMYHSGFVNGVLRKHVAICIMLEIWDKLHNFILFFNTKRLVSTTRIHSLSLEDEASHKHLWMYCRILVAL